MMDERLINKTEEAIKEILDSGINTGNIEYLYRLSKINHIAKEDKNMYYGNYGRYDRDMYGRYDEYGARRRDSRGRYMGHDHLDRMSDEYGRYRESRERYGAGEETDKSFHYMIEALEDFIKVLHNEANTDYQRQMLREALQRSMM